MMKIKEEWLWESLDGTLSEDQEVLLRKALSTDADLKERYLHLKQLHADMAILKANPSHAFVDAVMQKVGAKPTTRQLVLRWYPRVAAACVLLFVILFSVLWGADSWEVPAGMVGISDSLSPEDALEIWAD
ncbi:MAG: hypothetical protein AAGH79_10580 [Bacteroidota bacterium]